MKREWEDLEPSEAYEVDYRKEGAPEEKESPAQDARSAETVRPNRKEQTVELLVFLFLIVPTMTLSFFTGGGAAGGNFAVLAFATIVRDLALVSLILYFIWRNHEPRSRLGWRFEGYGKEAAVGLLLFVPMFLVAAVVERALSSAGLSVPSKPVEFVTSVGLAQELGALALVIVVAFAEETIFRGYLILRLKAITESPFAAVLLSAGIFSLGHGYEGTAGAVTVGVLGLIFAAVYLWRQSLVAPMVMHFMQDFIGIVLVPLLGAR